MSPLARSASAGARQNSHLRVVPNPERQPDRVADPLQTYAVLPDPRQLAWIGSTALTRGADIMASPAADVQRWSTQAAAKLKEGRTLFGTRLPSWWERYGRDAACVVAKQGDVALAPYSGLLGKKSGLILGEAASIRAGSEREFASKTARALERDPFGALNTAIKEWARERVEIKEWDWNGTRAELAGNEVAFKRQLHVIGAMRQARAEISSGRTPTSDGRASAHEALAFADVCQRLDPRISEPLQRYHDALRDVLGGVDPRVAASLAAHRQTPVNEAILAAADAHRARGQEWPETDKAGRAALVAQDERAWAKREHPRLWVAVHGPAAAQCAALNDRGQARERGTSEPEQARVQAAERGSNTAERGSETGGVESPPFQMAAAGTGPDIADDF